MSRNMLMRAASFAHLPGFAIKAEKKQTPKDREDEHKGNDKRDEREKDRRKKDREDEREGEEKKASDEDDAEGDPEEEGNEDEARAPRRAKKARAAKKADDGDEDGDDGHDASPDDDDDEGDDESDEGEMRGKRGKKAASARARERSRIRAILNSPHAAANIQLAAHLACNTRQSRSEAVATLKTAVAGLGSLSSRMDRANIPRIGGAESGSGAPSQATVANSWDAAFAKAVRR